MKTDSFKALKIIHTADFHIGIPFKGIIGQRIDEVRREDFRANVHTIFDEAIRRQADLLLISGDVFHRSDPSNKDFVFFAKEVGRVTNYGIHIIVIAGNHDKPKTTGAKNPLEALVRARAPYFHYIQSLPKEPLLIATKSGKKVAVVPIPYIDPRLVQELTDCEISYDRYISHKISQLLSDEKIEHADYSILMAHLTIAGAQVKNIWTTYISEPKVGRQALYEPSFDYIALGHVHTPQKISEKAYYPGSIERVDFSEVDEEKSFLYVTLDDSGLHIEKIKLSCRPMISTHKIVIKNVIDPLEIIIGTLQKMNIPPESIIKLSLETDDLSWRKFEMQRRRIEQYLFEHCKILGYVLHREKIKEGYPSIELKPIASLSLRKSILEYIKKLRIDEETKKRALKLAEKLMNEVNIL